MDFCGETIKPGYWITVNENPTDNYIKFDFNLKGSSGDLGASVIADYLTHRELNILEVERKDYFETKTKMKDEIEKLEKDKKKEYALKDAIAKRQELDSNYIPIDFDAYSIEDLKTVLN